MSGTGTCSSSVIKMKRMVEVVTAVTLETQTVTHDGRSLEVAKSMADYGIRKGNVLFLVHYSLEGWLL